jgi:ribosomal protein S18 acetylase RimI-like enzyme
MIHAFGRENFADHLDQLQQIAHEVLPICGFGPDAAEDFLSEHSRMGEAASPSVEWATIETVDGQTAVSKIVKHGSGWHICYLLPSSWPARYPIIRSALGQIREAFLQQAAPGHQLTLTLSEGAPSHTAYFAALLPEQGFWLKPRATMHAELAHLQRLELSPLPDEIHEIPYSDERLPEYVDLFYRAFSIYPGETRSREDWPKITRAQVDREGVARCWIGLECEGEIIGACFGPIADDALWIYNLSVSPAFCGRGLGRALVLRCCRRVQELGEDSVVTCALCVTRTSTRAVRLYHSLGFQFKDLWTDAFLRSAAEGAV